MLLTFMLCLQPLTLFINHISLSYYIYSVIFIDASQESCYGTVVTEHCFNLPKSVIYVYITTHLA